MKMHLNKIASDKAIEVSLEGNMSFDDKSKFRDISDSFSDPNFSTLTIDLAHLEKMDSNALGMLLVLKEEADKKDGKVILKNLNHPTVYKLFTLSGADKMFDIE